jgi:Skp family chaperone for outer membrane proteins
MEKAYYTCKIIEWCINKHKYGLLNALKALEEAATGLTDPKSQKTKIAIAALVQKIRGNMESVASKDDAKEIDSRDDVQDHFASQLLHTASKEGWSQEEILTKLQKHFTDRYHKSLCARMSTEGCFTYISQAVYSAKMDEVDAEAPGDFPTLDYKAEYYIEQMTREFGKDISIRQFIIAFIQMTEKQFQEELSACDSLAKTEQPSRLQALKAEYDPERTKCVKSSQKLQSKLLGLYQKLSKNLDEKLNACSVDEAGEKNPMEVDGITAVTNVTEVTMEEPKKNQQKTQPSVFDFI